MATTTPDNIQYPVNSDQVAPLASHFKNLADTTQTALNGKASTASVAAKVAKAGDTMTGALVLSGDPTLALHAATKQYVDAGDAALQSQITSNMQTQRMYVKNGAVALTKGTPVYITGADGTNVIIGAAGNGSEGTSSKTIGLLETDLAIDAMGYVVTVGICTNINTSAAGAAGDPVWLGPSGTLLYGLGNKPSAPTHLVYIGVVTRKNANTGEIEVRVQNGFELEELHNVAINSGTLADKQVLAYESATQLWKNKQATGGVTVGATAPTGPNPGDAWYNSNNGMLYVWYVDADSTAQWVQVKANSGLEASILARLGGLESQAIAYGAMSPNYVINGGFDIWQRGSSTISGITNSTFHPDRWLVITDGVGNVNSSRVDVSAQGVGCQYAWRLERTTGTNRWVGIQIIEGALGLVGKTVTVSFWVRKGSALTSGVSIDLSTRASKFGTGYDYTSKTISNASLSTSTFTKVSMSLPITTATSSAGADLFELEIFANQAGASNAYFEITGVQLEVGSTATSFRRAGVTMQGELAACQRYYVRVVGGSPSNGYSTLSPSGYANSTTDVVFTIPLPVTMRTMPSSMDILALSNYIACRWGSVNINLTSLQYNASASTAYMAQLISTAASGLVAGTPYTLVGNANASSYVGFSAEL